MHGLFVVFCFLLAMTVQAQPPFLSESVTLLVYDDHELWSSVSETGDTVIATANQYEPTNEENTQFSISHRAIALWDITTLPADGGIVQPTATYDLPLDARIGTALSADDRFLALVINDQLQIMRVPDLQVIEVFPEFATSDSSFWFGSRAIAWSGDFLAIIAAGKILLWNGDDLQTITQTDAEVILPMQNGWLLHTFNDSRAFMVCDRAFTACQTYTEPDGDLQRTAAVYSPEADVVVVSRLSNGQTQNRRTIWMRDTEGDFQPQGEWFLLDGSPEGFTTDGTFLLSGSSPDSSTYIWDVHHIEAPLYRVPYLHHSNRAFLPGDALFTEFDIWEIDPFLINIYDLDYTLQSTYNLSDQVDVSSYFVVDMTWAAVINTRYYLSLGYAIVVIPLETV